MRGWDEGVKAVEGGRRDTPRDPKKGVARDFDKRDGNPNFADLVNECTITGGTYWADCNIFGCSRPEKEPNGQSGHKSRKASECHSHDNSQRVQMDRREGSWTRSGRKDAANGPPDGPERPPLTSRASTRRGAPDNTDGEGGKQGVNDSGNGDLRRPIGLPKTWGPGRGPPHACPLNECTNTERACGAGCEGFCSRPARGGTQREEWAQQ